MTPLSFFFSSNKKKHRVALASVLNFISKSALKQATSWVKKESEAAPDATVQDKYASDYTKKWRYQKRNWWAPESDRFRVDSLAKRKQSLLGVKEKTFFKNIYQGPG
jgi:hypothetical protein